MHTQDLSPWTHHHVFDEGNPLSMDHCLDQAVNARGRKTRARMGEFKAITK